MYVLENGFKWLSGETSLWNPDFFWPNKGLAGLSDLHLGSLFLYSIPRFLGVSKFHSMHIWMISGVILSSCSAYAVARLLKFRVFSSCVCALVYASSLPIASQVGHAQLLQRWAAPWALLSVLPFPLVAWRRIDRFLVFVIATCIQYLCNPGLAIGLVAVSGIIYVSGRLMQLRLKPVGEILQRSYTAILFLCSTVSSLAAVYVSLRYFQIKSEYSPNIVKPLETARPEFTRQNSVSCASKPLISNAAPNPGAGILLTTTDAHTLTDGPTIYLAEDIEKIGRFYIQQSKIPENVFSTIQQKIDRNNLILKQIKKKIFNKNHTILQILYL
jgi:hypothetical protein